MFLARFRIIALAIIATAVTAFGYQGFGRPVASAGAEGARRIPGVVSRRGAEDVFMPPGYHLELVASEPLIQDPIVMDWDHGGPAVGGRDARVRPESQRA